MQSHSCHHIKHLLGRTDPIGQKRRWQVLIGRPPFYEDDQVAVIAIDEEQAAAKVGRALLDRGEPPLTCAGCGEPFYLVCLVEACGPLNYGSGCMFFAHHYAVRADAPGTIVVSSHPQVELLECGFAHLPECGGLVFLDNVEYMRQLEQFGLLGRLMKGAA